MAILLVVAMPLDARARNEPGVDEEPFSGGELRGFILSGPVVDWEDL